MRWPLAQEATAAVLPQPATPRTSQTRQIPGWKISSRCGRFMRTDGSGSAARERGRDRLAMMSPSCGAVPAAIGMPPVPYMEVDHSRDKLDNHKIEHFLPTHTRQCSTLQHLIVAYTNEEDISPSGQTGPIRTHPAGGPRPG